MATFKLAVILTNPSNEDEFLLTKQARPSKFEVEEYDSYIDSDLWDLPSVQLSLGESDIQVQGDNSFDLSKFDLHLALNQISEQVGIDSLIERRWRFWKYVEEPEFGPGSPIHTVFITTHYSLAERGYSVACLWTTSTHCSKWLTEVTQDSYRIGPLVANSFLHDSEYSKWEHSHSLHYQEYPLGIILVPMGSRTSKPFSTTNLVVIAPQTIASVEKDKDFVAYGDALMVDPGCKLQFHQQLADIVAALPRKLVVFVTHHHPDHVGGLSVIQICNPDAVLVAHKNTMNRIGKDDWSLGYTSVFGGEEICIGGQWLQVIFAPGHTDGHMGLLHISTHTLIVGDHCVGQGSAVLDAFSGGSMADYFDTTYKFLGLLPNTIVPMHGRVNLWPNHMLCQYLKNRRDRESSVLKAIENGATTLFEIVSTIYKDVDRRLWLAASSNVRLHVEHLAQQHKLPEYQYLQNPPSSQIDALAKCNSMQRHLICIS
ncbi:uncharacterized protein LOC130821090 isoform X2 [Amaranthus tricolor]|uniref:uncharacterized protein LOC130821090 isoform X2 n=1 Tax=Amaranthus tricolor TaxID=29722 RepID=UPI002589D8AC|nr:uncharacterized protein LOC130821090 isoform X2 [Amaranthus tricolor]